MKERDNISARPDDLSYDQLYSTTYSLKQLRKFLMRRDNKWKLRIDSLLHNLSLVDAPGNRVLDLGTSIGTFAIELAKLGYEVTGVDVDEKAVVIARLMADHYGLDVEFVTADASLRERFPEGHFDIIVAEDIFEHLHDDVLTKVLDNCNQWLRPGGYMFFHTYPTKYEYIFFKSIKWLPLLPFAWLRDRYFNKLIEFYHGSILNPLRKAFTGKTFEQSITYEQHCNLLTPGVFRKMLEASGMWVIKMDTRNLYGWRVKRIRKMIFGRRESFHQNISGICWKPLWPKAPGKGPA